MDQGLVSSFQHEMRKKYEQKAQDWRIDQYQNVVAQRKGIGQSCVSVQACVTLLKTSTVNKKQVEVSTYRVQLWPIQVGLLMVNASSH